MKRNKQNPANKQSFNRTQMGKNLKYCQTWGICRVQAWKIITPKDVEEMKAEWGVESICF